jgi:hypothetical protein
VLNLGSNTQGGLRAIFCQAEKLHERKDAHRKPPLPDLRVADVSGSCFVLSVYYQIVIHSIADILKWKNVQMN